MSCCNNNCLEPVYTSCIEYSGDALTCIKPNTPCPDNYVYLNDIIKRVDEIVEELYCSGEESDEITIDLKCLGNNCNDTLAYITTLLRVGNTYMLSFNIPSLIGQQYIVTVKVYSGGLLLQTVNDLNSFINIANISQDYVITIEVITQDNKLYKGGFNIPSNSEGFLTGMLMDCFNSGTATTISVIDFYKLLVTEICNIKSQLNVN